MVYEASQKRKYICSKYSMRHSEQSKFRTKHPFRVLVFLLSVGIIIEMIALIQLPDYTEEVEKARHDFLIAQARNIQLSKDLDLSLKQSTIEESARKQGMAYYGETIYIPIIQEDLSKTETLNP